MQQMLHIIMSTSFRNATPDKLSRGSPSMMDQVFSCLNWKQFILFGHLQMQIVSRPSGISSSAAPLTCPSKMFVFKCQQ